MAEANVASRLQLIVVLCNRVVCEEMDEWRWVRGVGSRHSAYFLFLFFVTHTAPTISFALFDVQ